MQPVSQSPLRFTPGIYAIRNRANRKVYIGSTRNLAKRMYEHVRQLRRSTHRNRHLQAAWETYGESNFEVEAIAVVHDRNEMLQLEGALIKNLRSTDRQFGYNVSIEPSNNQLGLRRSAETCAKIGASKVGNKNRVGATLSLDARMRIADKLRGRKASAATRAKLSAAKRGRPKSQAWVDKIQMARAKTMGFHYTPRNTP